MVMIMKALMIMIINWKVELRMNEKGIRISSWGILDSSLMYNSRRYKNEKSGTETTSIFDSGCRMRRSYRFLSI